MSVASAPGVKRLPLLRSRFRYWLAVAIAFIALAWILPGVDHRWFRFYPHSSRVHFAGQVGGGAFATAQGGAVGIALGSKAAARARGRAAFRYLRRAAYWLAVGITSTALVAMLAIVGARFFGYSPCVMYGGSMGSAVPLGSVAFIEHAPAESLKVGDVIIFRPPSSAEARDPLMHRIVSIEEADGQRVVRTKGDANDSSDPWELRLSGEGGRLVYAVPYVGYLLWFLQTRIAWAALILPLAGYLGFATLRWIWAPARKRAGSTTQAT